MEGVLREASRALESPGMIEHVLGELLATTFDGARRDVVRE